MVERSNLTFLFYLFFCWYGAIISKKVTCCFYTDVDIQRHIHTNIEFSICMINREKFWEKSIETFRVMCRATVNLCVHLCPVQCNSQSLGLWQRCMSMSCCFGIGGEPSGTDALLRIMCKYCRRVPEGVLTRVFFKPKLSLTARLWSGYSFILCLRCLGQCHLQWNKLMKPKEIFAISAWPSPHSYFNAKSSASNKTNHWFKTVTMNKSTVLVNN